MTYYQSRIHNFDAAGFDHTVPIPIKIHLKSVKTHGLVGSLGPLLRNYGVQEVVEWCRNL